MPTINSGDNAWMLVSSACTDDDRPGPGAVLWRIGAQENVLATMMQSFT